MVGFHLSTCAFRLATHRRAARILPALLLAACLGGCIQFHQEDSGGGITLEVAVFEGGYGIEWHKQVARQYEKLHPEIRINLWGDPRVDEKIKPRVLRRNPPDLANCSLPVWKLIVANKLYPLDEALDSPAYGQPGITWRQSLQSGILSDFQYQGKTYSMPSNFGIWVAWFDQRMFRKHGWTKPRTWGEFTALCDRIKEAGIAPLAFQGKYPTYAWATLLSLYQRLVPFDKWYEMEDIKPGAFLDPEFIHAAQLIQDMALKYFEPGAMAMTHTESQLEWVNGRAAMVWCGLWLKHEEKDAIPPGFEMDCFPVPTVDGGKGDPRAVWGGGAENFMVFRDAKHPREAADFLKYMVSIITAPSYCLALDTLSPVRNCTRGIPISPDLKSAVEIQDKATRDFDDRLAGLYLEWARSVQEPALAALLEGRITPQGFGRRLEDGMQSVRQNPDIYKPPARGVPAL